MSDTFVTDTVYEDGIEVVCEAIERTWGIISTAKYRVQIPDGEDYEFSRYLRATNRRQARLWAELQHQTEGVDMCDQNHLIPTEVAVLGKPAIAAYLYTAHDFTKSQISNQMGVEESTVQQYFTRFRSESNS